MHNLTWPRLIAFCTLLLATPAWAESVVVMPLKPMRTDAETVKILDELLLQIMAEHLSWKITSIGDIYAVLGQAKLKQTLGCEDSSCYVEVAGALGARYLLYGSTSMLGDKVTVSLNLLDPSNALDNIRAKKSVAPNENLYEDAMYAVVAELFSQFVKKFPEGADGALVKPFQTNDDGDYAMPDGMITRSFFVGGQLGMADERLFAPDALQAKASFGYRFNSKWVVLGALDAFTNFKSNQTIGAYAGGGWTLRFAGKARIYTMLQLLAGVSMYRQYTTQFYPAAQTSFDILSEISPGLSVGGGIGAEYILNVHLKTFIGAKVLMDIGGF